MITLLLATLIACASDAKPKTDFNGDHALQYAAAQMKFGPRVPNTPAHQQAGAWIIAQMKQRAESTVEQRWNHVTAKGDTLRLLNVLARFNTKATTRILYVTHWDSRPISDEAQNPAQRNLPTPGANDGASGVGLFVALADLLKKTPPGVGVDLLFVDGEDYGDFNKNQDVLIGSTYFADHLPSADYKPIFGVLFDMIGDRELRIPQEPNSVGQAPEVVSRVWGVAKDLGYDNVFVPMAYPYGITDDHIPLLKKGLHVIDVIDLDYCCHHQQTDTMDKISAKSLKVVGDVAMALVQGMSP